MLRNKWPTANEEQSEPIDHNVDMIVNPQPPTPQADNMQSDQSPIRIALFGYGVVGQGFHKALQTAGGNFELRHIVVKSKEKERPLPQKWFGFSVADAFAAADFDLVVEATNHAEDGFEIVRTALSLGLPVVSASKKMLATNLAELIGLAAEYDAPLRWEAAVGGAIPVISILTSYLQGQEVLSVQGILNGTSNYILTQTNAGHSYEAALAGAQANGFAETDPSSDVDGHDAAYKLCLLSYAAFGAIISPDDVKVQGIRGPVAEALRQEGRPGQKLKLIAKAYPTASGRIQAEVAPAWLDAPDPLFGVDFEYNAISIESAYAGTITLTGRGAGAEPTGSAVLANVVELAHWLEAKWHREEQEV